MGEYQKNETLKRLYIGVFLVFHFRDSHQEVSLISINMYHIELKPESYKFIYLLRIIYFFCIKK